MNRYNLTLRLICAGLTLWFAMLACSLPRMATVGQPETSTQSVELGTVDSARAEIEFPAGELKVTGGAANLMDGAFRSNVTDWRPHVVYKVDGSQGALTVSALDKNLPVGKEVINQWDIQLNNNLPLDLMVSTGAGMSDLDLSDLDLTNLRLEIGTGETNLDLSGDWSHNLTATINGGLGDLSIRLPANLGVRVNLDKGLVNVTATGLTQDQHGYVNHAIGTTPNTLTLDISGGVGTIALVAP
jgi:N-terminal domain of toast_rack, DUF2154